MGGIVENKQAKSRVIAGLLQIFLGGFALGRFYMGDRDLAITQIQTTVILGGMGIIWPLIDGIYILCGISSKTEQGLPLKWI